MALALWRRDQHAKAPSALQNRDDSHKNRDHPRSAPAGRRYRAVFCRPVLCIVRTNPSRLKNWHPFLPQTRLSTGNATEPVLSTRQELDTCLQNRLRRLTNSGSSRNTHCMNGMRTSGRRLAIVVNVAAQPTTGQGLAPGGPCMIGCRRVRNANTTFRGNAQYQRLASVAATFAEGVSRRVSCPLSSEGKSFDCLRKRITMKLAACVMC